MNTIAGLVRWLEPHAAHFVAAFLVTLSATQVVLGGQTFDVSTQHGALAFVVAFFMAVYRAFEASAPADPPAA